MEVGRKKLGKEAREKERRGKKEKERKDLVTTVCG